MLEITEMLSEDQNTIDEIALLERGIFPDSWSAHQIRSTIRQRHSICRAAREGERVLGYFLCYYALDECEIARIAVAQDARRRGVGQKLLDHMEAVCRGKEITRILLDVRKSNRAAAMFYEKNGFAVDGERKNYYGGAVPEDAILMSKNLPDESQMEDLV